MTPWASYARLQVAALLLTLTAAMGGSLPAHSEASDPAKTNEDSGGAPIEHPEALDSFFKALNLLGAGDRVDPTPTVRILHFGDSHTAADFLSGRLRRRLQEAYGDAGPGLLLPAHPWRGYPHDGVKQAFGRHWPATSLRGSDPDAKVGLPGAALVIPEGRRLVIRGLFADFRLHVLGPEGQTPTVEALSAVDGSGDPRPTRLMELDRLAMVNGHALRILAPVSPTKGDELSVALTHGSRLFGVDLHSGNPGVLYDELGLNGAELLDLERWDPSVRGFLLRAVKPDLLVLAYGTNDMGHADFDPADYQARATRLLASLKDESSAPILLVSPPDRAGWRRGSHPNASAVARVFRKACAEVGCAVWDAMKAMGGSGSIQRWRRQGLVQRDLVHLTVPGYQRLADLMYRALIEAKTRRDGKLGR